MNTSLRHCRCADGIDYPETTLFTRAAEQATGSMNETAQQRWGNYEKHLAPLREALAAAE